MTRMLGPSDYGLLTVTTAIIVWIEAAVSLGFSRATVKLVAEAEDWRAWIARVLQTQILVSLTAALLLVALAPILSTLLDAPQLKNTLRFLSVDIPVFSITQILMAIMVGRGSYQLSAMLRAGYWLSRTGLIFILVTLIPDVAGALLAILGASVMIMTGAMAFVRPPLSGGNRFSFQRIWGYVWPLFLYTVGINLFGILDLLFVKGLVEAPQAAGFYGAAKNLAIVPVFLAASFSPILIAKLTELNRQNHRELAHSMSRQTIRLILCLLPFAGMTAGAAPEVISAIYGRPFLPSSPALSILIFGTLGMTMISVAVSILIAAGHLRWPFAIVLPLLLSALVGHVLLIPRLGEIGAAWVTTAVACIGACSILGVARKLCHIRLPVSTFLRSIIVCGIAYFLSSFWPAPGFLVVIKLLLIGLTIVVLFLLIGEINRNDFTFLHALLRQKSEFQQ
ncbi:polysaccharide biosynthesis protein [delta proteobacterium NaphS2]|nr:polysaccharide biosynthesis protein [delta proteobacterium NaphS2]